MDTRVWRTQSTSNETRSPRCDRSTTAAQAVWFAKTARSQKIICIRQILSKSRHDRKRAHASLLYLMPTVWNAYNIILFRVCGAGNELRPLISPAELAPFGGTFSRSTSILSYNRVHSPLTREVAYFVLLCHLTSSAPSNPFPSPRK